MNTSDFILAAKADQELARHASKSQGKAMTGQPAPDTRQDSEDIRKAINDGMQDLRTR